MNNKCEKSSGPTIKWNSSKNENENAENSKSDKRLTKKMKMKMATILQLPFLSFDTVNSFMKHNPTTKNHF